MAISKKSKQSEIIYQIDVIKAREVGDSISLDLKVNGITIYGCWYRCGEKDGKEWSMVSFPAQKGKDGNYYNHVWFPITNAMIQHIEKQIESML